MIRIFKFTFVVVGCTAFGIALSLAAFQASLYPESLSDHEEEITVEYIEWACPCANWHPTHLPMADGDNCIFIEAAGKPFPEDTIWSSDWMYRKYDVKLIGSYYEHKGISRDYVLPAGDPILLPSIKARVFRYTHWELVERGDGSH